MNIHLGLGQHFEQNSGPRALQRIKGELRLLPLKQQVNIFAVIVGVLGTVTGTSIFTSAQVSDLMVQSIQSLLEQRFSNVKLSSAPHHRSKRGKRFGMRQTSRSKLLSNRERLAKIIAGDGGIAASKGNSAEVIFTFSDT